MIPERTPEYRRTDRRQHGSAYIITLLALFVLSAVGLTLVIVTQTEVQIGGNERVASRLFYGAESGFPVVAARVFSKRDYRPLFLTMPEHSNQLGFTTLTTQITATPAVFSNFPCALCEINNSGSYGSREYVHLRNVIRSEAIRYAVPGNGGAIIQDPGSDCSNDWVLCTDDSARLLATKALFMSLDQVPAKDVARDYVFKNHENVESSVKDY